MSQFEANDIRTASLTPRWAALSQLGRVAADLALQRDDVGEDIGLTAQFVGDHRRLARNRRNHGNADATALSHFEQGQNP